MLEDGFADGIILNYSWTETSLKNTIKNVDKYNISKTVYVGLDVFGRGCRGGGGFNSSVALELIKS